MDRNFFEILKDKVLSLHLAQNFIRQLNLEPFSQYLFCFV